MQTSHRSLLTAAILLAAYEMAQAEAPNKAVELEMTTDAHQAELLIQQDRFDDGLHSKKKMIDWGALVNHIILPIGVLLLMWFCSHK